MKVDDAVAHAFVSATDVFGLLGDSQMKWWAAMAASPGRQRADAAGGENITQRGEHSVSAHTLGCRCITICFC